MNQLITFFCSAGLSLAIRSSSALRLAAALASNAWGKNETKNSQ